MRAKPTLYSYRFTFIFPPPSSSHSSFRFSSLLSSDNDKSEEINISNALPGAELYKSVLRHCEDLVSSLSSDNEHIKQMVQQKVVAHLYTIQAAFAQDNKYHGFEC